MTPPSDPPSARPPKVSVFIPCYNYARYVAQAMESVLAQTDPDLELIVVDNGSTDNSWEVIQSFTDPRVRSFRIEKNDGVFPAWALGLEQSRGEWFSLLPADDFVKPQKHEVLLQHAAAHPEVGCVGAYIEQVDEQGRPLTGSRWLESVINQPRDLNTLEAWTMRHYVCIPTAIYRRSLCAVPASGITGASDYYFHLGLLQRGCRFACVPETTACYRTHALNTSMQEQPTAALQFAYCYARQFWPYLQESRQQAHAAETLRRFFALYPAQIRGTTRHHRGCILLCLFWPEWVVQHCSDYGALTAVDWEGREDAHPFHAVRLMLDESVAQWDWQEKVQPATADTAAAAPASPSPRKRGLRESGRRLERKVRHFLRGKKS